MNPEIHIEEGMAIGYRSRSPFRTAPPASILATAPRAIRMSGGRHLLLARNGRGKTTLLKTLAGLLPSLEGAFSVRGRVQFVDEDLAFDRELTPRQVFGAFFRDGARETAFAFAERLELDLDKPYGKLSKGNRQKVVLILAETHAAGGETPILLLDEPFSGLDFRTREQVDAIWRENEAEVLRLICVHPDEPTLKAESALLIRDGELEQIDVAGDLDWLETRTKLN